jgi:hypothetical protein
MVQHRKFLDLALDEAGVHTPDGLFDLASLTKAEVVRHRSRPGQEPADSYGGAVGGALLGGAVGGPLGFVGGGLLGRAIARDNADDTGVPRTTSATVLFESPALAYTLLVGKDQVSDAEAFVAAVKAAAGLK